MTPTTPLLGWFVIRKLGFDTVYLYTKFDDSRFSRSRDIIKKPQNLKRSRDPVLDPFKGDLPFLCWDLT